MTIYPLLLLPIFIAFAFIYLAKIANEINKTEKKIDEINNKITSIIIDLIITQNNNR